MTSQLYTVVQHSAAGYKGDPQFDRGLESRNVTAAQAKKVRAAGGVVFPNYVAAENYADQEMYPATYAGIIPQAPGEFARLRIDGLRVYKPKQPPPGETTT